MIQTIVLEPLLNLLLLFFAVLPGGFGVAIIALTVVIRLAMWPLIKKQIHHQEAMKALQPEMDKVKKRAKGDKQKEAQMMTELFKEKGMNPLGSIGLMLLQFPIIIALLFVFRDMITVQQIGESAYSFIQALPAIQAITTNPDLFDPTLFGLFHMAQNGMESPINMVLVVLAGGIQYLQAKQMTPQKSEESSAGQQTALKFTKFMPLVIIGVGSQLPSALPLYWGISSLTAIIQQRIIMKEEVGLMRKALDKAKTLRGAPASPPDPGSPGNEPEAAAEAPAQESTQTGSDTNKKQATLAQDPQPKTKKG